MSTHRLLNILGEFVLKLSLFSDCLLLLPHAGRSKCTTSATSARRSSDSSMCALHFVAYPHSAIAVGCLQYIRESRPLIYVTYNGDFFDWPFIETRCCAINPVCFAFAHHRSNLSRARKYGWLLREMIGIWRDGSGDSKDRSDNSGAEYIVSVLAR
mgnify:CR=1 FL=1